MIDLFDSYTSFIPFLEYIYLIFFWRYLLYRRSSLREEQRSSQARRWTRWYLAERPIIRLCDFTDVFLAAGGGRHFSDDVRVRVRKFPNIYIYWLPLSFSVRRRPMRVLKRTKASQDQTLRKRRKFQRQLVCKATHEILNFIMYWIFGRW